MSPQALTEQLGELVERTIVEQGPQFNGVLMQQNNVFPEPGVNMADPEIVKDGAILQHPDDGEAATAQESRTTLATHNMDASPEKVADVRRRSRKRPKTYEALIVKRARDIDRFGVATSLDERFGTLPQPTNNESPSTHKNVEESAAQISTVLSFFPQHRDGANPNLECLEVLDVEPDEADANLELHSDFAALVDGAGASTPSQERLEVEQAIEHSNLESMAAASEEEVLQIAEALAKEPEHNIILAEQLSRADLAEKRHADELKLALLLSQAEETAQHAARAAEKQELDMATAASLWAYKQAFEEVTADAFKATCNNPDAAVDVMLEAGVPTEAFHAFELTLEAFGTVAPPSLATVTPHASVPHMSDSSNAIRSHPQDSDHERATTSIVLLAQDGDASSDVIPTAR